ncbi:MAG: hypothetical protein ABIT71_02700 [Vicinamibacteraceae bacterium]
MRKRLGPLALAPMMVLLAWGVGEACKCAPEPTAVEALAMADAGFIGTIVDQRSFINIDSIYTGPAIEYDVIVQRAWKGVVERRITLRRLSRCSSSFGVGETSLIYAFRDRGSLVVPGCLPTKRLAEAAADLRQLGTPMVTFAGHAPPVARSLPISRWLRAHVVAGIGVYAFIYTQREWASPTWDVILLTTVAGLLAVAAAMWFVRRRWRVGAVFLAGSVVILTVNIFWTGHVFLRSDWSEPFLRW